MSEYASTQQEETLPFVSVDDFEGPFDVLLELARTHQVDISRVSLQQITDDFLTYIADNTIPTQQQLDFLLVAATLLLLKVQRALPQLSEDEEEEVTDLTDRLRLYQLYRSQAANIQTQWQAHPLHTGPTHSVTPETVDLTITKEELGALAQQVFARQNTNKRPTHHLRRVRGKTLAQCLIVLQQRLQSIGSFSFEDITDSADPQTKAVSLLAMLELSRRGEIVAQQEHAFAPINILRS